MESTPRPIEIFAPFGAAFELTKKILFQPFDFGKWLVIGFAAWLATFFSGSRFNFRHLFKGSDWNMRAEHHGAWSLHHTALWAIPFILIAVLFALALASLFIWLNARGRFVFTDCIVRNRAAIAEPWREYHAEGNSFFVFQFCVLLASVALFGVPALFIFASWSSGVATIPIIGTAIGLGLLWVLLMVICSFFSRFVVAVMYRQRCGTLAAFRTVWALFLANPGPFVLCGLFMLVLGLAAIVIGFMAGCLTCCIAVLPYVGTVILLPVVMLLFTFPLCFLRQFGDGYDVWGVLPAIESPPAQIPPIQEPPPPVL